MTDPQTFDWQRYITECLQSTNFCCISSVDHENGVWANPVFFAWDAQFNFYFISQMSSRHMQNISQNQQIAMAIYKTEQKDDVAGIQIEGTAKILQKDSPEIQHAYDTYYGRAGYGPDVQHYMTDSSWLYVQIKPTNCYYFDTRFFDEERQTVPMETLQQ